MTLSNKDLTRLDGNSPLRIKRTANSISDDGAEDAQGGILDQAAVDNQIKSIVNTLKH